MTILSLGFLRAQGQPSQIEAVQSDADVEKLVRGVDDYYANFTVNSALHFADKRVERKCRQAHVKAWEKADFDGNGRVDLLVTGIHFNGRSKALCLLDMGNGKLVLETFRRLPNRTCPIATVSYQGAQPIINYADFDRLSLYAARLKGKQSFRLVYEYGGFIEYNALPANPARPDSILYKSIFAYHEVQQVRLTLTNTGSAIYYACTYPVLEEANKTYVSQKTLVDTLTLATIQGLASYLAAQHLLPEYHSGLNHVPYTTLTISYHNGRHLQVEDEGEAGTFGLTRLYALLSQLHKSQTWQPAKP